MIDPAAPPVIIRLSVILPSIQRIAPKLSCGRKSIRRTPCHCKGLIFIVKLEHSRIGPGIGRVKGHINRRISDNLYPVFIRVIFQPLPLHAEKKLYVLIKLNVIGVFSFVIIQRIAPAFTDVLCPLAPGRTSKALLHGHK